MPDAKTVFDLLEQGNGAAVAIAAPGRDPLTFSALRAHIAGTVTTLNQLGVGRDDPVAIVLPNGPEMASAFVAIAAGATTAPLNPAYKVDEFEFYLSDLGAKLLVVQSGSDSPARAAAAKLAMTVVELTPSSGPAGLFQLAGDAVADAPQQGGYTTADDVARLRDSVMMGRSASVAEVAQAIAAVRDLVEPGSEQGGGTG